MIGGLGGDKFGSGRENKRPRLASGTYQNAEDVEDGDEDDGMELN